MSNPLAKGIPYRLSNGLPFTIRITRLPARMGRALVLSAVVVYCVAPCRISYRSTHRIHNTPTGDDTLLRVRDDLSCRL